jgi:uncharacterized surface protein with fasciclin (FAS1) repeats
MNSKKLMAGTTAVAMAATLGIGAVTATSASAGTKSLATVLTSDKNQFDKKSGDFDILTKAVLTVLDAKPSSPVSILADGKAKLTAFAPTDKAFQRLAKDLTGKNIKKEAKVFQAVAGLGVDTVEQVLLYHVVPGGKLPAKVVLESNGAKLTTAQGGIVKVKVNSKNHTPVITLKDKEPDLRNPKVILELTNINKGNRQIAHGINRVLLPVNL